MQQLDLILNHQIAAIASLIKYQDDSMIKIQIIADNSMIKYSSDQYIQKLIQLSENHSVNEILEYIQVHNNHNHKHIQLFNDDKVSDISKIFFNELQKNPLLTYQLFTPRLSLSIKWLIISFNSHQHMQLASIISINDVLNVQQSHYIFLVQQKAIIKIEEQIIKYQLNQKEETLDKIYTQLFYCVLISANLNINESEQLIEPVFDKCVSYLKFLFSLDLNQQYMFKLLTKYFIVLKNYHRSFESFKIVFKEYQQLFLKIGLQTIQAYHPINRDDIQNSNNTNNKHKQSNKTFKEELNECFIMFMEMLSQKITYYQLNVSFKNGTSDQTQFLNFILQDSQLQFFQDQLNLFLERQSLYNNSMLTFMELYTTYFQDKYVKFIIKNIENINIIRRQKNILIQYFENIDKSIFELLAQQNKPQYESLIKQIIQALQLSQVNQNMFSDTFNETIYRDIVMYAM